MTEQQEKAYEFLERYHQAKIKERGLDRQVERLRAEAECVRSASAVDLGWTGLMETDKRGRKTKIMAPIPSAPGTTGNSKIQNTMCELADKSTDLDLQQNLCQRLRTETEQVNRIKELEELRIDLIHYGHRIKVDRSIIRYYLSEKQRNILLGLVIKEECNLANPTLLQAIRIWWNSRKERTNDV